MSEIIVQFMSEIHLGFICLKYMWGPLSYILRGSAININWIFLVSEVTVQFLCLKYMWGTLSNALRGSAINSNCIFIVSVIIVQFMSEIHVGSFVQHIEG